MLMRRRALLAALALAGVHAAVADPMVDYTLFCMGCHGAQARGVPGKVPPLAGALSRFMRTPQGRDYVLRVPGAANSALSDAQLTGVLNWLAERDAGAGGAPVAPFTVAEVSRRPPYPAGERPGDAPRGDQRARRRRRCGTRPRLLTVDQRDAEGPRPERVEALQAADPGHERIDGRVVVGQGMRVGQVVDEGRHLQLVEARAGPGAEEVGARQREVGVIKLRAVRILVRGQPTWRAPRTRRPCARTTRARPR